MWYIVIDFTRNVGSYLPSQFLGINFVKLLISFCWHVYESVVRSELKAVLHYYMNTSFKRSVARRVTVLLAPQTLVIMFVILSKESFKKKAVRYSIKQRIKLLLLQKEANTTMQWSQVKTFEFVFIACRQFFFVLFLWDKFWCFYHFFELWIEKKNVLFMEIYEPMEKGNFL